MCEWVCEWVLSWCEWMCEWVGRLMTGGFVSIGCWELMGEYEKVIG